jgi:hypothetical protein
MKNLMSILPVVAITLASTADANAQAPVVKAVPAAKVEVIQKANVSEAAKANVQNKIVKPGGAAASFVKENGPSFVEWSAKQKGAEKTIDPVITPATQKVNIQKAAVKIKGQ